MVARVYSIHGEFVGRVVSVSEFLPNGMARCVVREWEETVEAVLPMEYVFVDKD